MDYADYTFKNTYFMCASNSQMAHQEKSCAPVCACLWRGCKYDNTLKTSES